MKNFDSKKSKAKKSKPFCWLAANKLLKHDCKNKKKKFYEIWDKKDQNIINTSKAFAKKKKNCDCDVNKIIYYNYNKKGHFATIYTK